MPMSVAQVLDDFGKEKLGEAYRLFAGWLETILGRGTELDACHCWVDQEDGRPIFKLLALRGNRIWSVALDARNGYKATSSLKGDISALRLEYDRATEGVILRIGGGEMQEQISATGKDAERLVALYHQLAA